MESKRSLHPFTALALAVIATLALGTSAAAQIVPAGEELAITSDLGGRLTAPSVAFGDRGEAVLVWKAEGRGVIGRRLDADSALTGPELDLAASDLPDRVPFSGMATLQRDPSVVALHDDGFLAAWVEERQHVVMDVFYRSSDVHGSAVFARRFGPRAEPAGEAFRVNTTEAGEQLWPAVARSASGSFLVAWMGPGDAASGLEHRVYGQTLDADASFLGPGLALSRGEARAHGAPTLLGTDSGYLVAWTVWGRHFPGAIHGAELDELG